MPANGMRHPSVSRSRWLWLGYWAALFVLTHLPMPTAPRVVPEGGDKVIHFGLYLALTLLGGRQLRAGGRRPSVAVLIAWAVVYACYGGLDEWLQRFVGRTPALGDWLANLGGVAAGTLLLALSLPARADR